MKIQVGTILIAKKVFGGILIVGKEYTITKLDNNYFQIHSEISKTCNFDICFLDYYFSIAKL